MFFFISLTGVMDFLSTEISTSKQKKFSLVTFIDTPGLVDGDMKYPFDVNEAILWIGKYQLVLVHQQAFINAYVCCTIWHEVYYGTIKGCCAYVYR